MRILYDIFFIIFGILYVPFLLIKKKGISGIGQKFGFLPGDVTSIEAPVWIHAVSVGESVLALKLAGEIKSRSPGVPVVISTTTSTGREILDKAENSPADAVFYYPFDLRAVVSRVVRLLRPRLYVIVETELWPNLLTELKSNDVPVVLVNGRISDKSFNSYKIAGFITKGMLSRINRFCMQSQADAEKIKELGAAAGSVFVTGNMKFDESIGSCGGEPFDKESLGFSRDDEIIIAGSTHFPEEENVIRVFTEIRKEFPKAKLVIAPRHVERTDSIKSLIEGASLSYRCFSDISSGEARGGSKDVLIVDTIGHLKDIYRTASVIFVGGSLAKKGGQNPIEGARWEKALIFGPHMFNFREVADIFLENNAAVCASDYEQFEDMLSELLRDHDKRDSMAGNAKVVVEKNSGAIDRTYDIIIQTIHS